MPSPSSMFYCIAVVGSSVVVHFFFLSTSPAFRGVRYQFAPAHAQQQGRERSRAVTERHRGVHYFIANIKILTLII